MLFLGFPVLRICFIIEKGPVCLLCPFPDACFASLDFLLAFSAVQRPELWKFPQKCVPSGSPALPLSLPGRVVTHHCLHSSNLVTDLQFWEIKADFSTVSLVMKISFNSFFFFFFFLLAWGHSEITGLTGNSPLPAVNVFCIDLEYKVKYSPLRHLWTVWS